MKKIKLPQPYAQMVACGALGSIPNIFEETKKLEKVFVFAEDFDDIDDKGLDFDNELHQRIWNEMTLGNIPDKTFFTDCFIGYVIVSSEEEVKDKWMQDTEKYLKVKVAKEFKTYIDNYETTFSVLEAAKVKSGGLRRMERNGSQLIVPVGKDAWNALKYKESLSKVFLFWEKYMSEITSFIFSNEDYEGEMTDIIFKYRNQTKRFDADSCGSNYRALEIMIDEKGKKKYKSYFTFDFHLLYINYGNTFAEIPSQAKGQTVDPENEDVDEYEKREFCNPRPRFISTPMGGMTKWKRR